MKTKQTPMQIAHEILDDIGWPPRELHHRYGRGKMPAPFDDVILLSVLPLSKDDHTKAHVQTGKNILFDDSYEKYKMLKLIRAMDDQIKIMIARGMI